MTDWQKRKAEQRAQEEEARRLGAQREREDRVLADMQTSKRETDSFISVTETQRHAKIADMFRTVSIPKDKVCSRSSETISLDDQRDGLEVIAGRSLFLIPFPTIPS
jgi:hypothetical protein